MSSVLYPSCDAAAARLDQAGLQAAHPRMVLIATILASSLAFVDGSVVNVGLPAIGRSLQGDASDLQWVINAYLLPLSALLLFGGALGDRFGRRNSLIAGVALFAAALVACALAPSLAWLLAGRTVQGIGAALLMPTSLAVLGTSFSGEAKGRAVGTWAAAGAIAGAVGPVVGGWMIDAAGWRAIFTPEPASRFGVDRARRGLRPRRGGRETRGPRSFRSVFGDGKPRRADLGIDAGHRTAGMER